MGYNPTFSCGQVYPTFGSEHSRLIERRFALFIAPRTRTAFDGFLKNISEDGEPKHVCETSLLRTDRSPFPADLQAMSAGTGSSKRNWCRVARADISARKLAAESRRRVDELAATNLRLKEEIVRRSGTDGGFIGQQTTWRAGHA